MCVTNTRDPRNALASWDGYEFQGQIALIVVLEMLIEKKYSAEKCEIMLEDIEDFSIYYNGERISIHQVKATKGQNISDYDEALYNMALGLQERINNIYTKAYLHTSLELDTINWIEDTKTAIQSFVPNTKRELINCLSDSAQIDMRVKKLKERFRNKEKITTDRKGVWEDVYRLMKDVNKESEIDGEELKDAINKYVNGMITVDLNKNQLLSRILYYDYRDHVNVDRNSTRKRIEDLIQEYWGEEISTRRKGSVSNYRYELQEIILCYVVENHSGNADGARIKFTKFEQILNKESLGTREYKIMRNKDIFYDKMEEYCDGCEKNIGDRGECEECDLYAKKLWFEGMNIIEIERAFHLMSPHVNKSLDEDSNIVNENGLMDSYFHTLAKAEHGKIVHNSKIVYQKGTDNYLLTDINVPKHGREQTIGKGLIENESVDSICNDIMANREFAKERMEIDVLIVDNPKEEKIRLGEICRKLNDVSSRNEDEWSYLKITQKKDIWLVHAEKFIDELY